MTAVPVGEETATNTAREPLCLVPIDTWVAVARRLDYARAKLRPEVERVRKELSRLLRERAGK